MFTRRATRCTLQKRNYADQARQSHQRTASTWKSKINRNIQIYPHSTYSKQKSGRFTQSVSAGSEVNSLDLMQVKADVQSMYQRCLHYCTQIRHEGTPGSDQHYPAIKQRYSDFNKLATRALLFLSE